MTTVYPSRLAMFEQHPLRIYATIVHEFTMKRPSRSGCLMPRISGFSLVETLVSLAVVSLIALMMAGVFMQVRPLNAIVKTREANMVADSLTDLVSREIAGALALNLGGSTGLGPVFLEGSGDSIRFSAIVRVGFQRSAVRVVTFRLVKDGTTKNFERATAGRRNETDAVKDQIILARLSHLSFRYLVLQDGFTPVWQDRFDRASALPLAVKVELSLAGAAPDSHSVAIAKIDF